MRKIAIDARVLEEASKRRLDSAFEVGRSFDRAVDDKLRKQEELFESAKRLDRKAWDESRRQSSERELGKLSPAERKVYRQDYSGPTGLPDDLKFRPKQKAVPTSDLDDRMRSILSRESVPRATKTDVVPTGKPDVVPTGKPVGKPPRKWGRAAKGLGAVAALSGLGYGVYRSRKKNEEKEKAATVNDELHDARLWSNLHNAFKSREERVKAHKKLKRYKHKTVGEAMRHGWSQGERLYKAAEKIVGGLADNKSDTRYSPDELKRGIEVEREHARDPRQQKEIAKDHLEESPFYYTGLDKLEEVLEEARGLPKEVLEEALEAAEEKVEDAKKSVPGKLVTESQLRAFFKDNPSPTDEQVHELAEANRVKPDDLEQQIYSMVGRKMKTAAIGEQMADTLRQGPTKPRLWTKGTVGLLAAAGLGGLGYGAHHYKKWERKQKTAMLHGLFDELEKIANNPLGVKPLGASDLGMGKQETSSSLGISPGLGASDLGMKAPAPTGGASGAAPAAGAAAAGVGALAPSPAAGPAGAAAAAAPAASGPQPGSLIGSGRIMGTGTMGK